MLLGSHSLVRVYFDTQHLFSLPQYLPVAEKLTNAGVECIFVLYPEEGFDELKKKRTRQSGNGLSLPGLAQKRSPFLPAK